MKPIFLRDAYPKDKFPLYDFGVGTYGGMNIHYWDDGKTRLQVGKYCSIANNVDVILGGEHRHDWVTTYPILDENDQPPEGHPHTKGDIVIGNDVWIGTRAIILSGVTIGDGAVIAAGTLVSKNVPPYTLWGGMPGKMIGFRFERSKNLESEADIRRWMQMVKELTAIAWWDWPEERIRKARPMLTQGNIDAFIHAVNEGKI